MRLFSTIKNFTKKNRKIFSLIVGLCLLSYVLLSVFNVSHDKEENHRVLPDYLDHKLVFKDKTPVVDRLNESKPSDEVKKPAVVDSNKILNAIKPKNGEKVKIYAMDHSGLGDNQAVVNCGDNLEVHFTSDAQKANFSYYINSVPNFSKSDKYKANNHRHYHMVFGMESEPHSGGGETWQHADFKMWYMLDRSFPEPATYFDVHNYLPDLLAPPRVDFDKKEKNALLVWILSNCNAFNSREKFVSKLMGLVKVDSFGGCLNNNRARGAGRMTGNDNVFQDYKFVITIENSNCEDYVTEKLVYAVKSGSIPLVAGKNGKPNYARYLPKDSYINVYDFKTVADLADYLKKLATNRTEYERKLHFKFNHNYTHEYLGKQPLHRQIEIAKEILGGEEAEKEFFQGIILKEKSENKVCKVARYIAETPRETIEAEIKKRRSNRPSIAEACLEHGNLASVP